MPRDGTETYVLPFPDVEEDTTIESTVYNGFTNDVAQDLNTPRPISSGGTGATNADQALVNLSGEKAAQVVTNYDDHLWIPGSFYSATSATGEPVDGHAFSGVAYIGEPLANPPTNANVTLEARDTTDGKLYIRRKVAGVWNAWILDGDLSGVNAAIALKVDKAGDTMTGDLTIDKAQPTLTLDKAASAQSSLINGSMDGDLRWSVSLGDNTPEAGSNAGSNFVVSRYDDAGALLAGVLDINRATGDAVHRGVTFKTEGTFWAAASGSETGGIYFGESKTKYLNYNLVDFLFFGATLRCDNGLRVGSAQYNETNIEVGSHSGAGAAYIDFHSSGNVNDYDARIQCGSGTATAGQGSLTVVSGVTNFNATGGDGVALTSANAGQYARYGSNVPGVRSWKFGCAPTGDYVISDESAGAFRVTITTGGAFQVHHGISCKAGIGGGVGPNVFNINHGASQSLWIDATNAGTFAYTSDYRIKKDIVDLPGMWDTVKALRPIKYTQAQFSPPSHVKYVAVEQAKARKEAEDNPEAKPREVNTAPLYQADDVERWGFIAHELQATLTESAASGVKDAPDTIQSPNPFTLIAALTKALQEAMARIEALEAK
jgi:hypothetical protein